MQARVCTCSHLHEEQEDDEREGEEQPAGAGLSHGGTKLFLLASLHERDTDDG